MNDTYELPEAPFEPSKNIPVGIYVLFIGELICNILNSSYHFMKSFHWGNAGILLTRLIFSCGQHYSQPYRCVCYPTEVCFDMLNFYMLEIFMCYIIGLKNNIVNIQNSLIYDMLLAPKVLLEDLWPRITIPFHPSIHPIQPIHPHIALKTTSHELR